MDRANAALAKHLSASETPTHLVGHQIDPALAALPHLITHVVPRPWGSTVVGELALDRRGRDVARAVRSAHPRTRILVNGGNCPYPDLNWAHCLHAAWPGSGPGAPAWFRVKDTLVKTWFRWRERRAFRAARLIVANSHRTKRELVEHLRIDPDRVHTVYLGVDPAWKPPSFAERQSARSRLELDPDRLVAAFVGTLDHDQNKGFDTLWRAWLELCRAPEWDVDLVVAGGGRSVARWQREVDRAGLGHRVRLLGFTDRVYSLFGAADVLVSPVRYEAYGLGVQEAVCRGVPAIVSARAGIVERFSDQQRGLALDDSEDAAELVAKLVRWRLEPGGWRRRFEPLAEALTATSWDDMAAGIVAIASGTGSTLDRPGTPESTAGQDDWAPAGSR